MKTIISNQLLRSAALLVCFTVSASAQTTVYSENFDTAPTPVSAANVQLGGSTKPTNAKYVTLGQWGFNPVAGIVNLGGANGNVLQVRSAVAQNGRSAGIFLDPALFAATGAGTYTLTFDVIPSATGVGRVYIGAGSGYDTSLTTEAALSLSLNSDGFGVRKSDGTIVWSALTATGGATAAHLITTSTEWIDSSNNPTGQFRDVPGAPFDVLTAATLAVDFEYDGSSTVVIAFGGYETDFKVDNITIATAIPAATTWAGYPIEDGGFVYTDKFLGALYVGDGPEPNSWVWSYRLNRFIWLPEYLVTSHGSWVYVPRR